MLIDLTTKKTISRIPYAEEYQRLMSRMAAEEISAIRSNLNSLIDGTEIQTAGWMPGSDWNGTVYMPIFEKAARSNYELSARFFGLMVWETFMQRPETWASGRFEKDGRPIRSRTYFRVH